MKNAMYHRLYIKGFKNSYVKAHVICGLGHGALNFLQSKRSSHNIKLFRQHCVPWKPCFMFVVLILNRKDRKNSYAFYFRAYFLGETRKRYKNK